ncbi:lamin tail domain-containing protein [Haloarcula sp. S1CR25-12]|uniref:Lamin tail domain-containing protein n=1 Tax=Haloarcula saliterrae TaxID=2950534 RepID=A0ABU2FFG3_9EURY|nr:lamin tail domain-containing protein [Haloarcula sp. S1CR25-12]MDS0260536.1 lamin tail domain-containing protein [Haloarcula sp. S1CR25-12]
MPDSRRLLIVCCVGLFFLAGCSTALPGNTAEDGTSTPTSNFATANGTLEVHYINVGQSVSTLVVGPTGETMLIDTGHFTDDGEYVLQYLRNQDIDHIDYMVVSHNDADHIGGNAAIIDYYETEADGIGAIYDPGIAASTQTYNDYLDAVEEHDVTLYSTREGDSIPFEDVDVDVFGPPEPYIENEGRNENSLVLKLTHGNASFLLTGDAEDDQEAYLVEEYGSQLDSTVLKAGHHGSSSSTSEALIDASQPEAVVISSAYDSQYGHPTEEVLQRLADRSLSTYWTATHGNIVLVSNGSAVSIQTQAAAPTEPLDIRSGEPIAPGTSGDVVERAIIAATSGTTETPTVATDGGTQVGGELAVERIHADAASDDRDNLNDEYVVFENTGTEPLDLSGWTVEDEVGTTYTFPDGFTLDDGSSVTLYTGSGTDTETELYWGSGSPIWNNGGDTIIVHNSEGESVLTETYE